MKRTTIAGLLMTPLLAVVAGCQPDTPAKHTEPSPVAAAPVASQVPAAEPMLTPHVAQSAPPAKAAKVAPSAPAVVPAVAAPAPVAAAPAAAKPVVNTAVLSDADGRKLAQKSGCFACHLIDKKLVGPSWSEVAAKYRGQKDAEAKLINKVAKGGSGAWGATPMPPNAPRVSENDVKALVRFILSLK